MRVSTVFTLFTVITVTFCGLSYASGKPHPENRYKIIQPVYLIGWYDSLNNRRLSKETAHTFLSLGKLPNRPYVAFQCEVPAGTTMTIIGPAPKVWGLPFLPNRYFIRLDPDLSRGLDVDLELNRGIEGSLDGLNPEFFSRLPNKPD